MRLEHLRLMIDDLRFKSPLREGNARLRRGSANAMSVCWRMIFLVSLISCLTSAFAQDLHFSQFFASPLTTSPSNTGFINGQWRVGGNFKSQWPWAIQSNVFNYRTFAVYGDLALLKGSLPGEDWLGVGVEVLNDRAGDGELKVSKIIASAAYHKVIGRSGKYVLSFGLGWGFVMKQVDYTKLYFDDQWNSADLLFDQTFNTLEPVGDDNLNYMDISAGTHFTYIHNKDFNISGGLSVFHLNKPKESFSDRDNRVGMRPLVNVMAYKRLTDRVHLEPGFMWMYEKKAQEYIIDLLAGFTLLSTKTRDHTIFIGAAGRPRDAIIPVAGYQYKTLRVLANFDVNVSSLTVASKSNGGFEISIVYTGKAGEDGPRMIPCPRL